MVGKFNDTTLINAMGQSMGVQYKNYGQKIPYSDLTVLNGGFDEGKPDSFWDFQHWNDWGMGEGRVGKELPHTKPYYAAVWGWEGRLHQYVPLLPGEEIEISGRIRSPKKKPMTDSLRGTVSLEADNENGELQRKVEAYIYSNDPVDTWHERKAFMLVPDLAPHGVMMLGQDGLGAGETHFDSLQIRPRPDRDLDGMPDHWEKAFKLKPKKPKDAIEDKDEDGLLNVDEYRLGTLPDNQDSDGDGIIDSIEVHSGLNPNDYHDAFLDEDYDGLSNQEELQAHTDPLNEDTDGDGLIDGLEIRDLAFDPLEANALTNFQQISYAWGNDFSKATGDWKSKFGAAIAYSGSGTLKYTWGIPQNDYYLLEIDVEKLESGKNNHYKLVLSWDGHEFSHREIDLSNIKKIRVKVLLPYAMQGEHNLSIAWNKNPANGAIKIALLRLLHADKPVQKTIATRRKERFKKAFRHHQPSYISPLFIEGVTEFLPSANVTSDWEKVQEVSLTQSLGKGWFANLPLNPAHPSIFTVSEEFGHFSITNTVTWGIFNVASPPFDDVLMRTGDALLLQAFNRDHSTQTFPVYIQGPTNVTFKGETPVPYVFSFPGTYTITGNNVTTTVFVAQGKFNDNPVGWVGQQRAWRNPDLEPTLWFEYDQKLNANWQEQVSTGTHFNITLADKEPARMTARLCKDCAITDIAQINPLEVYAGNEVIWEIVASYPDRSRVLKMGVKVSTLYEDISLKIHEFTSGARIMNGNANDDLILTAGSFNQNLTAIVYFLLAPTWRGSACHEIHAYQQGMYIGNNR